jgi:hypothetical protein
MLSRRRYRDLLKALKTVEISVDTAQICAQENSDVLCAHTVPVTSVAGF